MHQNFALEIESIISQLEPIRLEVLQAEQHFREELDHVYSGNLQSARNLVHYMSLRRHDIRESQEDLGRLALRSLGRRVPNVTRSLGACTKMVAAVSAKAVQAKPKEAEGSAKAEAKPAKVLLRF